MSKQALPIGTVYPMESPSSRSGSSASSKSVQFCLQPDEAGYASESNAQIRPPGSKIPRPRHPTIAYLPSEKSSRSTGYSTSRSQTRKTSNMTESDRKLVIRQCEDLTSWVSHLLKLNGIALEADLRRSVMDGVILPRVINAALDASLELCHKTDRKVDLIDKSLTYLRSIGFTKDTTTKSLLDGDLKAVIDVLTFIKAQSMGQAKSKSAKKKQTVKVAKDLALKTEKMDRGASRPSADSYDIQIKLSNNVAPPPPKTVLRTFSKPLAPRSLSPPLQPPPHRLRNGMKKTSLSVDQLIDGMNNSDMEKLPRARSNVSINVDSGEQEFDDDDSDYDVRKGISAPTSTYVPKSVSLIASQTHSSEKPMQYDKKPHTEQSSAFTMVPKPSSHPKVSSNYSVSSREQPSGESNPNTATETSSSSYDAEFSSSKVAPQNICIHSAIKREDKSNVQPSNSSIPVPSPRQQSSTQSAYYTGSEVKAAPYDKPESDRPHALKDQVYIRPSLGFYTHNLANWQSQQHSRLTNGNMTPYENSPNRLHQSCSSINRDESKDVWNRQQTNNGSNTNKIPYKPRASSLSTASEPKRDSNYDSKAHERPDYKSDVPTQRHYPLSSSNSSFTPKLPYTPTSSTSSSVAAVQPLNSSRTPILSSSTVLSVKPPLIHRLSMPATYHYNEVEEVDGASFRQEDTTPQSTLNHFNHHSYNSSSNNVMESSFYDNDRCGTPSLPALTDNTDIESMTGSNAKAAYIRPASVNDKLLFTKTSSEADQTLVDYDTDNLVDGEMPSNEQHLRTHVSKRVKKMSHKLPSGNYKQKPKRNSSTAGSLPLQNKIVQIEHQLSELMAYLKADDDSQAQQRYSLTDSITSSQWSYSAKSSNRYKRYKYPTRGTKRRLDRLETHVITLARSVAHLSSEIESQQTWRQEISKLKREVETLRQSLSEIKDVQIPPDPLEPPRSKNLVNDVSDTDHKANMNRSDKNTQRFNKLTRFFGQEPPLMSLFLKQLGYEQYNEKFEEERIGMLELPYMSEERLKSVGIPLGPRVRILSEAKNMKIRISRIHGRTKSSHKEPTK